MFLVIKKVFSFFVEMFVYFFVRDFSSDVFVVEILSSDLFVDIVLLWSRFLQKKNW